MSADLDVIVRKVTAFRSFAEIEAECRRGYVPTLLPLSNPNVRALADALTERGHKAFTGLADGQRRETGS